MFFILFVLDDPEKLEDLLCAWEEAGAVGVTIFVSTGMGRLLQYNCVRDDLPLIPSLSDLERRIEETHRTLFTVVDNQEIIDKLIAGTQRVVGELTGPDTGFLVVLPVAQVYGLNKNRD